MMFMNVRSQFLPIGVGFGGEIQEGFRLWIDQNLEEGYSLSCDNTFGLGCLMRMDTDEGGQDFRRSFSIAEIEVWGFGKKEDLEIQRRLRDRNEEVRSERRQVDKTRLMENEFDREILLGGSACVGERQEEVNVIIGNYRRTRE